MTTIVYRAGVLAADSKIGVDFRYGDAVKIRRGNGFYIGFAGFYAGFSPMFGWLQSGAVVDDFPKGVEGYSSLVVYPDYVVEYDNSPHGFTTGAEYYAIGSGERVAYGAMDAGASAREAVEIACYRDSCTDGPVMTMECKF